MENKYVRKPFEFVVPYTLGIYLLQWFIYHTMIIVFDISTTSFIYRPGAPFVIIPAAILICRCLKKIPVIRNIIP